MSFSISKGRGYLLKCSEGQEKALAKSTNAQSVYPLVASRGTVSESRASDSCLPELASNIMGVGAIRTLVGKSLWYKAIVFVFRFSFFVSFDFLNYSQSLISREGRGCLTVVQPRPTKSLISRFLMIQRAA